MFKYKEEENGITILGLVSDEDREKTMISIPEEIDGMPVVEIGDHAFYQCKQLNKVILPDTIRKIDAYGFAECRKLEQICMSSKTENIGDYAFYNCHSLMQIQLPYALSQMGYGAFKNCSQLKKIELYTDGQKPLAVGALIDDSSHELEVELHDVDGQILTKLIFTEFDYDCILQVEARQFDWVYHGSGNVYRQCISAKGIDFTKYDELFPSAIREDWPVTAMKIALGRVLHPYKLNEEHQQMYMTFLKEKKTDVFMYYLKNQQIEEFEQLLDDMGDENSVASWIDLAKEKEALNFVSLLMDYQQKHFGRKTKSFDL